MFFFSPGSILSVNILM